MSDYSSIIPSEPMIADDDRRSKTRWRLVIDEDGDVSLDTRTYYGGDGTPFDEWHKRTLAYRLAGPGVIDADRLREDLAEGGALAKLIDVIVEGHEVVWDGSNYVGHLDEDADEASWELGERLAGQGSYAPYLDDDIALWDVGEWMSAGGSNSLATQLDFCGLLPESNPEGEAVREAAEAAVAEARSDGVILTGDVEGYIADLIRRAREEAGDEA